MSWPQSNVSVTSALPRLVVDCTLRTPGMDRSASSTGRVTSTAIRSAGRSPASRSTRTRGKSMCGNSDTGSAYAPSTPPATRASEQEQDRPGVAVGPPGRRLLGGRSLLVLRRGAVVGGATMTAAPSSSSSAPAITTASPSCSPSPVIAASLSVCTATLTACLTALPSTTVKIENPSSPGSSASWGTTSPETVRSVTSPRTAPSSSSRSVSPGAAKTSTSRLSGLTRRVTSRTTAAIGSSSSVADVGDS